MIPMTLKEERDQVTLDMTLMIQMQGKDLDCLGMTLMTQMAQEEVLVMTPMLPERVQAMIPTILMENVGHYGGAQNEAHLVASHPDLDAFDVLRFQFVALLHVNFVYARACEH